MKPFLDLFERYCLIKSNQTSIEWSKISTPNNKKLLDYSNISKSFESIEKEDIKKLLSKLVVLKLNGGLGRFVIIPLGLLYLF
jgi:UDP-N-acetylglucosamine pyrophosphorylase